MFEGCKAVGIDIETTGLDPFTSEVRLIQLSDGQNTRVYDMREAEPKIMGELWYLMEHPDVWKIGHNLSFDTKFLLHHFGWRVAPIFDTLIAAQVLEGPQGKGWYKLDSVVKRYIDAEMSKDQQRSDWSGKLTKRQLDYAAKDAEILVPLAKEQKRRLIDEDLLPTARLEFEAVSAIVEMELSGMKVNIERMIELGVTAQKEARRTDLEFSELVGASDIGRVSWEAKTKAPPGQFAFDLGECNKPLISASSPDQALRALQATGLGIPDTKDLTLRFHKQHPAVEKLLEHRHITKRLGYFDAYPEHVHTKTGRVHTSFIQIGPVTGRMASRKPNVQNCPRDEEFRNLFIPEDGHSIMSADFDGQEMRILTEFTQEPVLLRAFRKGDDLHKTAASLIYGKPVDEIDKETRSLAKNLQFGILYGRGAKAFAADIGITEDRAQELIDTYFDAYPYVQRWIWSQRRRGEQDGFVRTLGGRKCPLNLASETGAWRREAVNYPIQGSGADMMKAALTAIHHILRDLGDKGRLIAAVHDEVVLEVQDKFVDDVSELVTTAMSVAGRKYVKSVEVLADVATGKHWSK